MEELQALIQKIIDQEWQMFVTVNGESDSADHQENPVTFAAMRKSQFLNWSPEAVASYADDVDKAQAGGRNLMREKFLYMMQGTAPQEYIKLCDELPKTSPEKRLLVNELSERMLKDTAALYKKYPYISSTSRPLYAVENTETVTSAETYQKCELLTYSVKTLQALEAHIAALEKENKSLAEMILGTSLKFYGYPDIATAEKRSEQYWTAHN